MKTHQVVRVAGIVGLVAAYAVKIAFEGNGPIHVLGYELAGLGLVGIAVVVITVPEVVDRLPFGPTRDR